MSEKKDIKLIASDLDGTLLKQNKELTARTKKALRMAHGQGIELLVSTGRPLNAIPEELMKMDEIRYYMYSNGAGIFDKETGEMIYHACMTGEQFAVVYGRLKEYPVWFEVSVNGIAHVAKEQYERALDYMPEGHGVDYLIKTRLPEEDYPRFIEENAGAFEKTCVFYGDRALFPELLHKFDDRPDLAVTSAMWYNVEVSDRKAEKGAALQYFAEREGIPLSCTAAFGDNRNDLGLLKAAGFSVAVGNAEDVLKEASDYVGLTNEEEGVARVIEEFILK